MASNPPSACCTVTNFHEGTPKGQFKDIAGLDSYEIGVEHGNETLLVIITDIFGYKLKNVNLIADKLAETGKYHVIIPDFLNNDPFDPESGLSLEAWLKNHDPATVGPVIDQHLKKLRLELSVKSFKLIGYCFGAKFVIQQLSKDGIADVGATAHPSFVTIDEVKAVAKPLLISAAQYDPIFTTELRHQTEKELENLKTVSYQIDLFSGVSHGFAVKGDYTQEYVKYASEKVLSDQLVWFNRF